MAKTESFDISTGVEIQEVDNAVNQARREIATRFDFKGTNCTIDLDRKSATLQLEADDEYRLKALMGVLRERLVRRGVPVKNLSEGTVDTGTLGRARQLVSLKQGIDRDTAGRIVKDIKAEGFKKVQVQIQGEELRVFGPKRDTLQQVIAVLKGRDYGLELKFGNYR